MELGWIGGHGGLAWTEFGVGLVDMTKGGTYRMEL